MLWRLLFCSAQAIEAKLTKFYAVCQDSVTSRRVQRDSARDWIASLYPPADKQPWGVLQPDRLLERFIGLHIEHDPEFATTLPPRRRRSRSTGFSICLPALPHIQLSIVHSTLY